MTLTGGRRAVGSGSEELTRAAYARAESYLPWNVRPMLHNIELKPNWIGESDRFWYRRTSPEGAEFVLVDPASGERRPAFDHVRLAEALSRATGRPSVHNQLPFEEIAFEDDGRTLRFAVAAQQWSCDLDSYACTNRGPVEPARKDEVLSPDKQWAAFLRDGNLFVRHTASGEERALTSDAEPYDDYATLPESRLSAVTDRATGKPLPPVVAWSPDSTRLFTYRLDQRQVEPMVLVQSVPPEGSHRPLAHPYRYPLPGDAALATGELLILDLEGKRVPLQTAPLHAGGRGIFETGYAWWGEDGKNVYFVRAERGGQAVTLEAGDAASGETRTLLEERGASTVFPQHVGMEISNVKVLDGGAAFTWFSAKSGWGHLSLYDAATGEERN
ncbi:MAG TPA: DPP IV N-terminal domain-containing protein, partial [Thermomicrobiaceae bacterium]|nr:DPP IV N-terminal domain-containing protein [Thermomicrobiaceae bacterium]